SSPTRVLQDYTLYDASIVLPNNDICSLSGGSNESVGDFIVLGTSTGISVYFESSGEVYSSFNQEPVISVKVVGNSLWYVQGSESTNKVCFVEDVFGIDQDSW